MAQNRISRNKKEKRALERAKRRLLMMNSIAIPPTENMRRKSHEESFDSFHGNGHENKRNNRTVNNQKIIAEQSSFHHYHCTASKSAIVIIAIAVISVVYLSITPTKGDGDGYGYGSHTHSKQVTQNIVPNPLFDLGVYKDRDFRNERGIRPPFWGNQTTSSTKKHWGPCFPPIPSTLTADAEYWQTAIADAARHNHTPTYKHYDSRRPASDVAGFCRPSFLIIGAGKCGTSSLYHYLVDHPRVLPARQKQIHYFKYYSTRPLRWYYSYFPTTTSFLANGALMTGEASPGYLPYPDVPDLVYRRLPGVRILMLGRNPIERMYSSYQYNYVYPMIQEMQKGKVLHVERGKEEDYYFQFLFSFEEMVLAELNVLKSCLDEKNGTAVMGAMQEYSKYPWVVEEKTRREKLGLPPMADVDGHCYGNRVDKHILRKQWTKLQTKYPNKVILDKNTHLIQSFIGRSLYVLPLEWWYARMGDSPIYFLCTEELSDVSGRGVARVASFLGLPDYNFSGIVQKGAYNVGGHRGYDNEVSWEVLETESHHASIENKKIPLSDEVLGQVKAFVHPYNEQLFHLTGRRCNGW